MSNVPCLPALYIGRFQPFHFGHFDALEQIAAREESIIIAIGSAEDDFQPDNPFTAGERYQMISAVLESKESPWPREKKWAIIPVRNINHYALWVKHIETLLPPFGTVYTGSAIVARLFAEAGGHNVAHLQNRKKISGTEVREKMAVGGKWGSDVPLPAQNLIHKWQGVKRLEDMQK